MEKYEILETLGDGAFGVVYKAVNTNTKEIVAIKKFKNKFYSFQECKNLREVKSLSLLNQHSNLIKILEMIYTEDKILYLIFDYMKENLYEVMKSRINKKLSESQIKCIIYQLLQGIAYMHKYGFFHRDLKPENILLENDQIKIADFGLAREIRSVPPYTDYVSTRWYRAPECLLKSTSYNSPVDIWALGCIMIELYNLKPIFPGNSEKDVLFKICSILGVPNSSDSANIITLAKMCDFKFPININSSNLSSIVPDASKDAISFLKEMLQWNPNSRSTAINLLNHPYFTSTSIPTKILSEDEGGNFNSGNTKKFGSTITKPLKQVDKNKIIDDLDDDFSKILEDTQDFNKFINKLKDEKKEDDNINTNNSNFPQTNTQIYNVDSDIKNSFLQNSLIQNSSNQDLKNININSKISNGSSKYKTDIFNSQRAAQRDQYGSLENKKLVNQFNSPIRMKKFDDPLADMKKDLINENIGIAKEMLINKFQGFSGKNDLPNHINSSSQNQHTLDIDMKNEKQKNFSFNQSRRRKNNANNNNDGFNQNIVSNINIANYNKLNNNEVKSTNSINQSKENNKNIDHANSSSHYSNLNINSNRDNREVNSEKEMKPSFLENNNIKSIPNTIKQTKNYDLFNEKNQPNYSQTPLQSKFGESSKFSQNKEYEGRRKKVPMFLVDKSKEEIASSNHNNNINENAKESSIFDKNNINSRRKFNI